MRSPADTSRATRIWPSAVTCTQQRPDGATTRRSGDLGDSGTDSCDRVPAGAGATRVVGIGAAAPGVATAGAVGDTPDGGVESVAAGGAGVSAGDETSC